MSNGPIAGPVEPKFILEGRIVTMGPAGVIPNGAIYVDAGRITAVQPAALPRPAGFDDALRVATGDTIYPGLIELHNHLSYNAMPLWDVPRKFTNNNQWKSHDDYRVFITKPAQVLGQTPGVVEAVVRFVESRALLGGVTTTQGITLANAAGIQSYYQGIVRNVEQTGDDQLPEAGTRIANPDTGGAQKYLTDLADETCYLQHLSEGTDETARGWFSRLQLNDGSWAVTDAFCGIHSAALNADDLKIIADRHGSMVWSPLSNYLLYGGTVNLRAAKQAGILMGLGCDWAPSGSKNLLGELKVAWLASQEQGDAAGPVFRAEEIVRMTTTNPAQILKWQDQLGSIEAGKRADLIALNGQQGDVYLNLIEARETTLTLVIIDGIPRLGQKSIMERGFGLGTETIRVGGSTRVLNLEDPTAHLLLRDLKLGDAIDIVKDAMERLPELAAALDNAGTGGLFSGNAAAPGATMRIVLEFEEEEPEFTLAALPFADFVRPLQLEPITVADDPKFLENLVASRNLPDFVKKGLPKLYGEDIPLPDSARFLDTEVRHPPELHATTRELDSFRRTSGELTPDDRRTIVDQALVLLQDNYVHLPLKRAMYGVDPVQRLRLLRHRMDESEREALTPEIEFHNELADIFSSIRDLHTIYRLPSPYRERTAWLPFLIEECWELDHRTYLVTKVVGDAGPVSFKPGVEVLYWNGLPIHQAVLQNARRQAGGNDAARFARGLNSLTTRPLAHGLPPEEEWVTLVYRGEEGAEPEEWTQKWLVFEPTDRRTRIDPDTEDAIVTAMGMDAQTDDIQEVKRILYAGDVVLAEDAAPHRRISNTAGGLPTLLPTVFRAVPTPTRLGTFGYIRIFTFNVNDADTFVDEFARLAQALPDTGLIIDVRGNGGGLIHVAERLLQLLTPRMIEPERAQFINTPLNLQICRNHAPSTVFADLSLRPWIDSIALAVRTGAIYSAGYPITPPEACNSVGRRYFGPVLLIIDGLCYSATDMFAAGFQDHGIGPILGVSENTGAGGANVWSHGQLRRLLPDGSSPYRALPKGADLRVAMRRTIRVGLNAGGIVEDLGIEPDRVHRMTRRDIEGGNEDLIDQAAEILAALKAGVSREEGVLHVETGRATHFDLFVNERAAGRFPATGDVTSIALSGVPGWSEEATVEVQGFEENRVVAHHRRASP